MAPNSPLLGGPPPSGVPSVPSAASDSVEGMSAPPSPPSVPTRMLSEAQGRYDAVKKVVTQLARTRKGLDALVAKGDAITSDDVLDEMAELVAHGADPKNLAAIIAGNTQAGVGPMPPGGEPLAGWLKAAEQNIIAPAEAAFRPAMALAQHQLGVAAVHKLVEVHAKAQAATQASIEPPTSPALGGASPGVPQPNIPAPSLLQ